MASCVLQCGWSSNCLGLDTWRRRCMIDSIGWICRHGSNLNYVLLRIDVSMVWLQHIFPGCASRCRFPWSLSLTLGYFIIMRLYLLSTKVPQQVNFWFPPAKQKQLDQGHLQLPAQLLGSICQSNFRIQPTVTVSQLSKWNWKHIFSCKCWPDTTFIFIYFLTFWRVFLC